MEVGRAEGEAHATAMADGGVNQRGGVVVVVVRRQLGADAWRGFCLFGSPPL